MSTSAPNVSSLLELIEDDTLVAVAPAIVPFLTSIQAANADPVKMSLAVIKLPGDLLAALPGLEGSIIAQISGVVLTKVQALLAKAEADLASKPA